MKPIASALLSLLLLLVSTACGAAPAPEGAQDPITIIHGGGLYDRQLVTNSLAAVQNAYDKGYRYIELDFVYTTDGHLICRHDPFDGTLSDFTGLTLEPLLAFLSEHPDVRIITDVKENNLAALGSLAEFNTTQFIPQIYSFSEYGAVAELGFSDMILTLYRMTSEEKADTDALVSFSREHPLFGITFPKEILTSDYAAALSKAGTRLFTHTVNEDYEAYFGLGLTGVYTDIVEPLDWFMGFYDVYTTDNFTDSVAYVVENGLMRGVGDGLFAPYGLVNRETYCQVLYNQAGKPPVQIEKIYSDETMTWYRDAVAWAEQQGLIQPLSDSVFGIGQPYQIDGRELTRAAFAQMLYQGKDPPL